MAIVALVLWLLTASAGIWLLRSGKVAGRQPAQAIPAETEAAAASAAPAATAVIAGAAPATSAPATAAPSTAAMSTAATAAAGAGSSATPAAPPLTEVGLPPPTPHTRVATPPGEHPVREFLHPMLAITGLACWIGFVLIHNRAVAWVALGVLAGALTAGLGWLSGSRRAARHHPDTARVFPPRLIALHGVAAATVVALAVLSALSATGRG